LLVRLQGVNFVDFLPILRDPAAFETLITHIVHHITSSVVPSLNANPSSGATKKVNAIVGLDSRGFLIGPIIALRLGAKFVPVRKAGKLPGKTISATYEKEYGEVSQSRSSEQFTSFTHAPTLTNPKDSFELQEGAIDAGDNVIIVDDVIATGEPETCYPASMTVVSPPTAYWQ
jgi:adenine phosphoribosyltransferase